MLEFPQKKTRSNVLNKIPRAVIFILLVVGFWYVVSVLRPQITFFSWTAPFHIFIRSATHHAANFFFGIVRGKNIADELERSRQENATLYNKLGTLHELERENAVLRSALSLKELFTFETIPADVVDFQSDGFREILIIKWNDARWIEKGMTVVSPEGILVGKIESIRGLAAEVMLLSDPRIAFSGEVVRNRAAGAVRGAGLGRIAFERVEKRFDLEAGDFVVTSAIGGVFPQGLAFGKIATVRNSDLAGFISASVEPISDPRLIRKVLIITKKSL